MSNTSASQVLNDQLQRAGLLWNAEVDEDLPTFQAVTVYVVISSHICKIDKD